VKLEEFSRQIISLEKKYPVWTWEWNGLLIWPVIRTRLYLHFKKQLLTDKERKFMPSMSRRFGFFLNGIAGLFKLLLLRKGGDIILTNTAFRSQVGKVFIDRIADPLQIKLNEKNGTVTVFEFASGFGYKRPAYEEKNVLRLQVLWLLLSRWKRRRNVNTPLLKQWDEFINELGNISPAAAKFLKEKQLKQILATWWSGVLAWKAILAIIKPSRIFINCYYDDKGLAITGAARLLGIKTVDLQHGVQGEYHLAYSSWNCPDELKFKAVLPDYFFVWNEFSGHAIEKGGGKYFLTGYPWIEAWKRGVFVLDTPLPENIILYTLQPLDDPFPETLHDFLRSVPSEYNFYIRVHPHDLPKIEMYRQQFQQLGLDITANFEEASHLPLPYLLSRTKLHITKWSSVAIEASYFNVPTLLIHQTGVDLFSTQMSPRFLFYQKNFTDITDQFSTDSLTAEEPGNLLGVAIDSLKSLRKKKHLG
jgi:hypothetical protein